MRRLVFLLLVISSFAGSSTWPDKVPLELRVITATSPEKEYLGNLVGSIIQDRLAWQLVAHIPDVRPLSRDTTIVPVPQEDPGENFESPPDYLPVEVVLRGKSDQVGNPGVNNTRLYLTAELSQAGKEYRLQLILRDQKREWFRDSRITAEEQLADVTDILTTFVRRELSGPERAALFVTAEEADASVYLEGRFAGKAPVKISDLPLIPLRISVIGRSGVSGERTLQLKSGDNRLYFPARAANELVPAEFLSSPAGARVYIDMEYAGETPLRLMLVPGRHHISYRKDGFITDRGYQDIKSGFVLNDELRLLRREPAWIEKSSSWAWITAWSTAISAGMSLYAVIQRDSLQEDILRVSEGKSFSNLTASEQSFVRSKEAESDVWDERRGYALISTGINAGLFLIFYSRYMLGSTADLPESRVKLKSRMTPERETVQYAGYSMSF